MMATKLDRQIARAIVMAQISSDTAKGIYWETTPANARGATQTTMRYRLKCPEIIRALRMIDSTKGSVWRYYVELAPDQNGYPSYLVYFETKDEAGKRLQISFHNPANSNQELDNWVGKGRKTRWNRRIGGSRDDAKRIVEMFGL